MNVNTFRYAIFFVGTTLVLSVLGIIVLAWGYADANSRQIPDILQNLASGALAGLIGLLVTPRQDV